MNKNDFYKELMKEYALDPEKIRMSALKQAKKPAWQKVASTYWKPALGTAAAAAVAVGAISFANRPSAPDVIVAPEVAMSASQRLMEADKNYYNIAEEDKLFTDMYVTFMEPVSYNEILMMMSAVDDSGNIELCTIYLEDSKILRDDISAFAAEHADEETAVAAKLSLPIRYYRDVQDLSLVYLAELGSDELNDKTFAPIAVDDGDPLENDHLSIAPPVTTTAVVTTTPFSFEIPETSVEEVPVIGDSSPDSTVIPPITTTPEETTDEIYEETTEVVTTTEVPETTPAETTSTTYYRGDVGLLTEIYELNVQNALSTYIAGDNVVVLSKEQVYIYTIGGFVASKPAGNAVEAVNPKLAYMDNDRMVITGCTADGIRNILIYVNTHNDTYLVYDASANIGNSEIASVSYCNKADKFYLKAVSQTSSLVYEIYVDSGSELIYRPFGDAEITFRPLVEVEAPISVAGSSGDILYFTTSAGGDRATLYGFNCLDGTLLEYASFSGDVKIKRSSDFRSFAVFLSDGTSFIYDVETEKLISTHLDDSVQIVSDNGETFYQVNGINYKLSLAGEIIEADRAVAFDKEIEQQFIINEITPEKVVVFRDDESVW